MRYKLIIQRVPVFAAYLCKNQYTYEHIIYTETSLSELIPNTKETWAFSKAKCYLPKMHIWINFEVDTTLCLINSFWDILMDIAPKITKTNVESQSR